MIIMWIEKDGMGTGGNLDKVQRIFAEEYRRGRAAAWRHWKLTGKLLTTRAANIREAAFCSGIDAMQEMIQRRCKVYNAVGQANERG